MIRLLPAQYKIVGTIMSPLGFILWVLMQQRVMEQFFTLFVSESDPIVHTLNVLCAIVGFFSMLVGFYILVFSKEKIEDEMIKQLRLESFQFAAFVQILGIIVGFILIFFNEPNTEGYAMFFVLIIMVFWLSFIARFRYLISARSRSIDEE